MNQCLFNIGTRIGSFTFRLALVWNNRPSVDWMEKCSSGNGGFLGLSAMGSMNLAPSLGSHASGTFQMRSGTVSVIHAHCCVDAVPQERAF